MAPRRQPAATLALLSLLASVDRCNAECSRPATTPAGYDLSGVVETTLTQGATFDVTGVVCDSSGGFVASGAGPAASTCTTDATSYILSGCAATAAATCGEFAYSCSELSSAALWGAELEAQVARIGLAALVGAIIGLQREFGYAFKVLCSPGGSSGDKQLNQRLKGAAGLRTHMLASIAACIFTIVSQHGFTKTVPYSAGAGSGDPARIAAQIVSGVGFLGAGTIIKGSDGQLSGLTTATTIWTSAALGICAGSDSLDDRLCLIAVAIVVACLQDWAHARIGANAATNGSASCTFKLRPEEVEARTRAVIDKTTAEVGEVRHCTVEVTQPADEPDGLTILQMKLVVCVVVGESKGLAFVLAMQSMEGFAAAAMDNAGPKWGTEKMTAVIAPTDGASA